MNAISEFLASILLVMSSSVAALDNQGINSWEVIDQTEGGMAYVDSEIFNNSGLGLIVTPSHDCEMLIAPMQVNDGEDARSTIEKLGITSKHKTLHEASVVKVSVDNGETYTWTDVASNAVSNDGFSYRNYSPVNLTDKEGLFAEMLAGTKLIFVVDNDATDEVSLVGFSKAASSALDSCEEELNNVASNEWGA